jgi:transcriptional regulator with XRE-family HTH domain
MSSETTPTLARRYIGETLERQRIEAGLSRGRVATELGKSAETIRRWENGEAPVSVSFIRDMGRMYEAPLAVISRLCALALETKQSGLFEGRHVPTEARVLWESETTAQLIRSVELENIPGLLQTPEYHRTVQAAQLPVDAETAERSREFRTRRQRNLFGRKELPRMEFMIGRAAIDYTSRHPGVYADQLARLREVANMPEAEIRVIADFHAGMLGSFTLITPRQGALGARPFVYIEAADGVRYEESSDVVSLYEQVYPAVNETAILLEEYLK